MAQDPTAGAATRGAVTGPRSKQASDAVSAMRWRPKDASWLITSPQQTSAPSLLQTMMKRSAEGRLKTYRQCTQRGGARRMPRG